MTVPFHVPDDATVALEATAAGRAVAEMYAVRDIWTTAAAVRAAPRVFGPMKTDERVRAQ